MKLVSYTVIYSFLVVSFSCSSNHQNKNNDLSDLNLYGKVKSIKEITYHVKDDSGKIYKDRVYSFLEKNYLS